MPVRRSIFVATVFGALLLICCGAAWAVWDNTREAQQNAVLLHERDKAIHDALGEIRANLYLTAILTRDAMLDQPPTDTDYAVQFEGIAERTQNRLESLDQQLAGDKLESALNRLAAEWNQYKESTSALLAWTPEERLRGGPEALRQRVGHRRDILLLTEQLEALATQSSAEQQELLEAGDIYLRGSLGWIAGVALFLIAGIAIVAVMRMRGLERQSEIAEFELRSLSTQLRTAQETERRNLSRELHDQVGQMLTGLRMELAAIARSGAASNPEVHSALERAKSNTEHTLNVVRNIAMLLRPSMLDDLGLTPALIWLAREMERSSGMEIRRDIDDRVDQLPDSHRTCLYRVVQEALNNAVQHSGARTIDLRVKARAGWVRVEIVDDGRGFQHKAENRKGLGLIGMEERVRELGGQMHVATLSGRGASVEILLPQPAPFEVKHDDSTYRGRSRNRADRVETTL